MSLSLVQVFFIFYGLFALATPVLVIALYVRYGKLRVRVNAAEEETAKQIAALRQQIFDLKKQLSAPASPSPSTAVKAGGVNPLLRNHDLATGRGEVNPPLREHDLATSHGEVNPAPNERAGIGLSARPQAPPIQQPPKPAPPQEKPKIEIAAKTAGEATTTLPASSAPPVHPAAPPTAALAENRTEAAKPKAAPEPPKPASTPHEIQVAASTKVEPKTPKILTPAGPAAPKPPIERIAELAAVGRQPKEAAPAKPSGPMAARVSVPSPSAALRVPAQKPSKQERLEKVSAFEEALGTNWLQKLGIVLLVLGIASFGIYELAALGALGKVFVSYLAGAALLGGGIFLERRERYQLLGRTGIGGGWALLFFTTYALYHVAAMHVLDSLVADSALMLLVAAAMGAHTLRYRSQFVTGLAFLLGYSTVALSHDTVYSLSAGVILAMGLVGIVLKMGWYELEVFGILSSYLNHLYWLYRLLGAGGAQGRAFPEYHASLAMLFFYWATYRVSYVLRRVTNAHEEGVSTTAAVLNTLLLLGVMRFQSVQPELAYLALLVVGAVEFACALLPGMRARRQAFVVLSVMGAALMLAAVPFHYSGNNVALLWLVGTEVFLVAGIVATEVVFRRIGLLTGLLVGGHLVLRDFEPALKARARSEQPLIWAPVLFGVCASVLYANAAGIGRKWSEFFEDSPDRELLISHSYIAAFCAAVGVWAFFTRDWTAVAVAVLMATIAGLARSFESSFESGHLQVQYMGFAVLTGYFALSFNLHLEAGDSRHVGMRLMTLPILAAAFYGTAKLALLRDGAEQRVLRAFFAFAGTATVVALIWLEAPELWRPIAFIAFAIALTESGRALKYPVLAWHTHVVCALAGVTALTVDSARVHLWHTMPVHAFSALAVIAGYYWLAKRGTQEANLHLAATRAAYTWAAAGLSLWALAELLHAPWIAVGWIALAVALAIAARGIGYAQLAWQANAVAVCAILRTIYANYDVAQRIWPGVSLRIVTIAMVAAGLYFVARRGAPNEAVRRVVGFFHSFAATGLLAGLMYYEAPNGWLAPLWAGFALALALIDRRWESEELPWQTHILALLALARAFAFNIHLVATWHGWSVRLLSLVIVAIVLYVVARVVRMPEEWRERDLHHAYSWAASVLASMLVWYELQPLSVAVGWAVFGLILFEYGLLRRVPQFRYQAYVAFLAAFARIFFVNLTAGDPGQFFGPRLYTIAPLVMIFFLVYAQLLAESQEATAAEIVETEDEHKWHVEAIVAYLGTAALAALLRFQFMSEWVVTAWAALALVLFAAAWLMKRELFLQQGMIVTLLTLTRGLAHNLFGSGYFSEGDWKGRYFVVGAAVGLLLLTLAFAFPLRAEFGNRKQGGRLRRAFSYLTSRPEQLQFFAPMVLLTLMLALKMRAGMVTVSWGIEGLLIIVLALAVKERSFRLTGLGLLLLCVGKILVMDVWGLQARDRYITLIIVGAALLAVSYLYSRHREAIRQFL